MFALKTYQARTLDQLRAYLGEARFKGAKAAYDSMDKEGVPNWRAYRPVEGLETTPFVCMRLPTGGGKTSLAAHAVKIAADAYLETEWPLVLWLVPTNTIRMQTLETLMRPDHPNCEILRVAFDGRVQVLDIANFTQIRPQDIRSRACIVVGTIQTLRVESTDGRKVYAHNEHLEPHFSQVPDHVQRLDRIESGKNINKIRFSFRNLLALHRPLVLVDEAHNASTNLSYEVMRRIRAACIVEFTATPAADSNVLVNVSATELKAEEMIKLPIRLTEHKSWEEAVRDSVLARKWLADLAKTESDYIRPIVLFQAEKRNQDVTKDVLLRHLVEQERVPREQIAVVTGDQRELDGIDLFNPACAINFVITVEALKEGWDCSFAYVFCSVASVHSARDVEQILGRVLRMPYAKRRDEEGLNRAYAHVASTSWPHAVKQLHDRLVDMGFEDQEADSFIERQSAFDIAGAGGAGFAGLQPLVLELAEDISSVSLTENEQELLKIEPTGQGCRVTVSGPLNDETIKRLGNAVRSVRERKSLAAELKVYTANWQRRASPAQRNVPFKVPQLCFWQDGELQLAEKELFLDAGAWDLLDSARFPAELSESEFNLTERGLQWEIDIKAGKLRERVIGEIEQFDLNLVDTGWTDLQLARWLDRKLRQPQIGQAVLLEFLRRHVAYLIDTRRLPLPALVRARYVIAKVLAEQIRVHRDKAFERGYQANLFGPQAAVETSFAYDFEFTANGYAPHWAYHGSYGFPKHYYHVVGELKNTGEEYECAKAIDLHPTVKHWVRNLARREESFWLPTSTGRFYPDFVAELEDGRILVIEYKGADRATTDESKEKRNVGELWEEKSDGKALFLMPVREKGRPSVAQQLADKIGIAT